MALGLDSPYPYVLATVPQVLEQGGLRVQRPLLDGVANAVQTALLLCKRQRVRRAASRKLLPAVQQDTIHRINQFPANAYLGVGPGRLEQAREGRVGRRLVQIGHHVVCAGCEHNTAPKRRIQVGPGRRYSYRSEGFGRRPRERVGRDGAKTVPNKPGTSFSSATSPYMAW